MCESPISSCRIGPRRGVTPALLTVVILLGCASCSSSSGPRMTGFGLGDSRIVSVGELVELKLPLSDQGTREWRVSSYDSLYLAIAGRPQVIQTSSGGQELLVRARARTPGETIVEVTEQAPTRGAPQTRRFTIRIVE